MTTEREAAIAQLAEAVRYWLTRHEMYLGVDRSDGQGWRDPVSFAAEVIAELGSDDDSLAAEAALTVSEWEPWTDHGRADIPAEWWATPLGRLTLLASAQTSGEVTISEACAMLRVSRARIYQLLDAGKLERGPDGGISRGSVMLRLETQGGREG